MWKNKNAISFDVPLVKYYICSWFSESVHRDDDINGIQLPIPETETLRTTSKNEHRSRLLTGETEC